MGAQLASRSEGGGGTGADEATHGSSRIDALWLETLHRIAARSAHEIKGALNGVAVNLEVVRSRAEKPDARASAVSPYANAATDQLAAVIAMTEALLSLARPPRAPVDLAWVIRCVAALTAPVARADGRELEIDDSCDDLGVTSAAGSAVRLAIGECFLAAIDASARVRCCAVSRPDGGQSAPAIRLESRDAATIAVNKDIVAAAGSARIRIQAEQSAITISFPR